MIRTCGRRTMLEFGPTWRLADIRGMTERADEDVIECQALDGARQRLFCRSCRDGSNKDNRAGAPEVPCYFSRFTDQGENNQFADACDDRGVVRPWLSQNEPLDSGLDYFDLEINRSRVSLKRPDEMGFCR